MSAKRNRESELQRVPAAAEEQGKQEFNSERVVRERWGKEFDEKKDTKQNM